MGQCPSLTEFYAAKEQKEKMRNDGEIKTKIFGSSTLRLADQIGLRADVCCMSGGGLGQIVQASLDDPSIGDYENVVIMGGANDIRTRNFTSNETFAANIDKSLDKLATAAGDVPEKNFFVLHTLPHHDDDNPFTDNDQAIRQLYLLHRLQELSARVGNISSINAQCDVDATGHPTEAGTVQLMNQVSKGVTSTLPIIWNPAFIVSDRAYRCVESIFRYGCNICDGFGTGVAREKHSNQLVCDDCYETLLQPADNPLLATVTKSVLDTHRSDYEEQFPDPKRPRTENGTKMDLS